MTVAGFFDEDFFDPGFFEPVPTPDGSVTFVVGLVCLVQPETLLESRADQHVDETIEAHPEGLQISRTAADVEDNITFGIAPLTNQEILRS